jgi:predicted nuclease of predicted toxin-antitoxin system
MTAAKARSKKRSGANSIEKLRESFVFFLDRNLGTKHVAHALRAAGATVEIHNDHFPQDAKDVVWLPEVGKRGWVVLTKDDRIRYRPAEFAAVIDAQVALFALASGNLNGEEMAQAFVTALPRMLRFLAKHHPPFIAKVTRSGEVSIVFMDEA